jgi:hypothetical protein
MPAETESGGPTRTFELKRLHRENERLRGALVAAERSAELARLRADAAEASTRIALRLASAARVRLPDDR